MVTWIWKTMWKKKTTISIMRHITTTYKQRQELTEAVNARAKEILTPCARHLMHPSGLKVPIFASSWPNRGKSNKPWVTKPMCHPYPSVRPKCGTFFLFSFKILVTSLSLLGIKMTRGSGKTGTICILTSITFVSFCRFVARRKTLSTDERAHWDDVAAKDKERYMAEKQSYTGPWQVPWKRAKKDPSAPKVRREIVPRASRWLFVD